MSGHLVLLGQMHAGKSELGRALAHALGRRFLDNDEELLRTTGSTAAELAERRGRVELHRLERECLGRMLRTRRPAVVTAAASAIDDPGTAADLARRRCVYVVADPETLAARGDAGRRRSILGTDSPTALADLAARRDPLFRAVASLVVDTREVTVAGGVQRVLEAMPDLAVR